MIFRRQALCLCSSSTLLLIFALLLPAFSLSLSSDDSLSSRSLSTDDSLSTDNSLSTGDSLSTEDRPSTEVQSASTLLDADDGTESTALGATQADAASSWDEREGESGPFKGSVGLGTGSSQVSSSGVTQSTLSHSESSSEDVLSSETQAFTHKESSQLPPPQLALKPPAKLQCGNWQEAYAQFHRESLEKAKAAAREAAGSAGNENARIRQRRGRKLPLDTSFLAPGVYVVSSLVAASREHLCTAAFTRTAVP